MLKFWKGSLSPYAQPVVGHSCVLFALALYFEGSLLVSWVVVGGWHRGGGCYLDESCHLLRDILLALQH